MNVLPVALGLVPDGLAQAVMDSLAADIAAKGYKLDVGVYALRYLPRLLSDHGHGDTVWKVVTRTDEPSWGFWLKNDIRSMPEGWGLGSRSWNHHYFASISSWFYEGLAGIRPAAPGYARIQVRPFHAVGPERRRAPDPSAPRRPLARPTRRRRRLPPTAGRMDLAVQAVPRVLRGPDRGLRSVVKA